MILRRLVDRVRLMKIGNRLLVFCLLSPTTGCFVGYGIQNSVSSPLDAAQECLFRYRTRQQARDAWRKVPDEEGKCYSADYVKGFEDGFVDYVDAGGNGEPPAAPPPHRQRTLLRWEEGQNMIEDWYAGFRHGARVARASGLRERAIMPIARPPLTPTEPYPAQVVVPAQYVAPAPAVVPAQVVIPAPAVVPSQIVIPAPAGVPGQIVIPAPAIPAPAQNSQVVTPTLGFAVLEK